MYFYDYETELRLRYEEEQDKKKAILKKVVSFSRRLYESGYSAEEAAELLGYYLELAKGRTSGPGR